MSLEIYNSMSRKKEEFVPINEGRVHMYVCGPTVYDYPHIGHAKSYISFDVIARYFRYLGYKVRYVQNITDVGHLLDEESGEGEDRILKGAAREKLEPMEVVQKYTNAYFDAMDKLNVERPDISPHATAHVPEQIEFTQALLDKGYAYQENGSVYFNIEKWDSYGKLSGRKIEDQQAGARLAINDEKKHPADFALWKKAAPEHLMKWNSPWGSGYPGWHLECSVMAMKYLGETIDIHGGGLENQFPHHECEIAQSESLTGKKFVNYWIHNNMVLVDGVKMSKSLGNFTTVGKALEDFTGEQIRFFILQTHYRSTVNFSKEAITASAQGLSKLHETLNALAALRSKAMPGNLDADIKRKASEFKDKFISEMNDDFNTPSALAVLFDFSKEINKLEKQDLSKESLNYLYDTFYGLGANVLGLFFGETESAVSINPFVDLLVDLRTELRGKKEWALSDKIRDQLIELGIELKDGPGGTNWTLN